MESQQAGSQQAQIIVPGAVNGIDLCSIQEAGGAIDAKAIAAAGFEFAYVKSSQYSSVQDLRFDKLVDSLRSAGLSVGAYHFCSHDKDPIKQAEFFFKSARGLGSKPGELPPMADWEFCTASRYINHPQHCVDWIGTFLKTTEGLWYPNNADRLVPRLSVLYSFPNYCRSHQPALEQSRLGENPLCFASYREDGSIPVSGLAVIVHQIPKPWNKWTLCQYSGDKGRSVPGIRGACDRQVFNGTTQEFAAFRGIYRPVDSVEGKVTENVFRNQ